MVSYIDLHFFSQEAGEPEIRITRYAAYSVGEVAPVLVPKDSVSSCTQCAKEFVKETRKHHCRACGNVCTLNKLIESSPISC